MSLLCLAACGSWRGASSLWIASLWILFVRVSGKAQGEEEAVGVWVWVWVMAHTSIR